MLRAGAVAVGGAAALAVGGVAAYYATRYPASAAHSGWLVLRGATVLSGADLDPVRGALVLVRDGRIEEVGVGVGIPRGARVFDLAGCTVVPGLIDMHTHLGYPDIEPGAAFGGGDVPRHVWAMARYMPRMRRELLRHGVTAVRSLGDELGWVLELRQAVAEGTLEGPRVFCAGPVLTTPGGHPISTHNTGADSDAVRIPRTPRQAEAIVSELLDGERPVDVIKVIQESGAADVPLASHTPEVLAAIAAAAHARGVAVTAHCGTVRDLVQVVEAGFDGVEHLTMRDPSATVDGLVGAAARAWPQGLLEQMVDSGLTLDPTVRVELANRSAASVEGERARERVCARVLEAHRAGVPIVAGSDAAVPGIAFGAGLVREIQALGAAGLSSREALGAATVRAAAALGSGEIGVVEPGRDADLLVVEGDPLADLGVLHRVVAVLRQGRVVVGDRGPVVSG